MSISLPKELQEKLNKLGNTPLQEPELYSIIQNIKKGEASFIDIIGNTMSDEEIDKFSISEIKEFGEAVEKKITDLQDEDGYYKFSEKLQDWQPPKPSQAKKVFIIEKVNIEKRKKLLKDIKQEDIQNGNVPEKVINAFMEMAKEMEMLMFEISGVTNIDELSEWEKDLLLAQTTDAIKGLNNSFLGKK